MILSPDQTIWANCSSTSSTPFLPRDNRTYHALRRLEESMRSIYKGRELKWRSAGASAGIESGGCPGHRLRCRRQRDSRPYFRGLREKKRAGQECTLGIPERSARSDPPVFEACLPSNHSAHDSKPTRCVWPQGGGSYRTDLVD